MQTRVDIPALRAAAANGRNGVSAFRELIDSMEQEMNASESFWEGDAAELYRSVFRRELSALRQAFEQFAAFPNEIDAVADEYDVANRRAEAIASSEEQAVWADV